MISYSTMFTIIPSLDVMSAVTDNNIKGTSADLRRISFDESNLLLAETGVGILIEGLLFDKIKPRLNEDHIRFFQTAYRIDESASGVADYNIYKSINFVAEKEAKTQRVIILTDSIENFSELNSKRIVVLTPNEFLGKVEKARELYKNRSLSCFTDALMAVIFIWSKDK